MPASASADVRGTTTILFVEDEPGVRRLAQQVLEKEGYALLSARNGKHALEVMENHSGRIDLIVTDVVMPVMSGPELAEIAYSKYPEVRILFISGHIEDPLVRYVVTHANFLRKPFTPKALKDAIRALLEKKVVTS